MIKYIRLNYTEKIMGFIVSLVTSLIAILVYLNTDRISGEKSRLAIRTIMILIGSIAVLNSISRLLVIVPPGNVGVVNLFGEVSETTLNPGVHWVWSKAVGR